ncbi:MAG: hypothetical protein NC177_12220 [Ruminococcus flavefaciens]|nr:hypothetical protein [Ruminococcus flavefaciens]
MKEISGNAIKLLAENLKKFLKNISVKKINHNFLKTEIILGFEIHSELKEFLSLDFCIKGVLKNEHINFKLFGGRTNIIESFDKSYFDIKDDFICCRHFCTIGVAVDGFLEFDNDTGEVYFCDFEMCRHYKIADSVRELLLKSDSI